MWPQPHGQLPEPKTLTLEYPHFTWSQFHVQVCEIRLNSVDCHTNLKVHIIMYVLLVSSLCDHNFILNYLNQKF